MVHATNILKKGIVNSNLCSIGRYILLLCIGVQQSKGFLGCIVLGSDLSVTVSSNLYWGHSTLPENSQLHYEAFWPWESRWLGLTEM